MPTTSEPRTETFTADNSSFTGTVEVGEQTTLMLTQITNSIKDLTSNKNQNDPTQLLLMMMLLGGGRVGSRGSICGIGGVVSMVDNKWPIFFLHSKTLLMNYALEWRST